MKKILATPRSFGSIGDPVGLLEAAGYTVVKNPVGGIMTEEQMKEHIRDAVGIVIGVDPLNAAVLAEAKCLKAISKYGVGTDNIDMAKAKELGIPVSITTGANANAVADYAFTLMAACARKLIPIDQKCHEKDWGKVTTQDIYGKTVGILGLGAIGKGVAKRAQGFDMKVLAYDVYWNQEYADQHGITYAKPEDIYREADFISLHMPLTEETRGMISDAQFQTMKPSCILVNTARGGIIDEAALVSALKEGTIYAAGIDAFEQEPPKQEELYQLSNLIMGSHCAASTTGAVEQMGLMAAKNLLAALQGST